MKEPNDDEKMKVDDSISEKHYMVPEQLMANTQAISEFTFSHRIMMWMNNMRVNMPTIIDGKPFRDLVSQLKPQSKGRSAIVIGGGPSIEKYGHLDMLAKSNYGGMVLTCDRNLVPCIKRGIIPDVVCSLDGAPQVANFYKEPIIKKSYGKTKAVFCAQTVHPDVVALWRGDTYWFIAIWDDPFSDYDKRKINSRSLTAIFNMLTLKDMVQTVGNVGTTLWNIASYLDVNPVALIGFDMGYLKETPAEKTPYYETYYHMLKAQNKLTKEALSRFYRLDYNPDFKTWSKTDLMFETYAASMKFFIGIAEKQYGTKTVNCTGGGIMHGPMITGLKFEDFLKRYSK